MGPAEPALATVSPEPEAGSAPLLFVLAFDHRAVLHQLYDDVVPGGLGLVQAQQMKEMVVDAVIASIDDIAALGGTASVLMDELYGGSAVRRAQDHGVTIAMPLELSGAPDFTLEWGDDYLAHLDSFHVDYAKVLVFLNPGLAGDPYEGQMGRVGHALSGSAGRGYPTMLEVVVGPTAEQLEAVQGDRLHFDSDLRPALVARTITDFYADGTRPTLWKLEGLETKDAYDLIARTVSEHDPEARCLVLGRGENDERVNLWLELAATCPMFTGFAVGRSIWREALSRWLTDGDQDAAVAEIRTRYVGFAQVYALAAGMATAPERR